MKGRACASIEIHRGASCYNPKNWTCNIFLQNGTGISFVFVGLVLILEVRVRGQGVVEHISVLRSACPAEGFPSEFIFQLPGFLQRFRRTPLEFRWIIIRFMFKLRMFGKKKYPRMVEKQSPASAGEIASVARSWCNTWILSDKSEFREFNWCVESWGKANRITAAGRHAVVRTGIMTTNRASGTEGLKKSRNIVRIQRRTLQLCNLRWEHGKIKLVK